MRICHLSLVAGGPECRGSVGREQVNDGLARITRELADFGPSRHRRPTTPVQRTARSAGSESRERGADVLGQQVEVHVSRVLGIERFKPEPLPPTEGGRVQCGDDDSSACCFDVQLGPWPMAWDLLTDPPMSRQSRVADHPVINIDDHPERCGVAACCSATASQIDPLSCCGRLARNGFSTRTPA
jgi:hypothetical protein